MPIHTASVANPSEVITEIYDFLSGLGWTIHNYKTDATRNSGDIIFSLPNVAQPHALRFYMYSRRKGQSPAQISHLVEAAEGFADGSLVNGCGPRGFTHWNDNTLDSNQGVTYPAQLTVVAQDDQHVVIDIRGLSNNKGSVFGVGMATGVGPLAGQRIPWCDGVGSYVNTSTRQRSMFHDKTINSGFAFNYNLMAGAFLIPERSEWDDWEVGDGAKWCDIASYIYSEGVHISRHKIPTFHSNHDTCQAWYRNLSNYAKFEPSLTTMLMPCVTGIWGWKGGQHRQDILVDVEGIKAINGQYLANGQTFTQNGVQYVALFDDVRGSTNPRGFAVKYGDE